MKVACNLTCVSRKRCNHITFYPGRCENKKPAWEVTFWCHSQQRWKKCTGCLSTTEQQSLQTLKHCINRSNELKMFESQEHVSSIGWFPVFWSAWGLHRSSLRFQLQNTNHKTCSDRRLLPLTKRSHFVHQRV